MTTVKPGLYKHFKGDLYVVVAVVLNVEGETDREMVLYEKLGPTSAVRQMFVRSVGNFVETVKRPEYEGPRFNHVGSTDVIELEAQPGADLK
jgi:hypothetical protein